MTELRFHIDENVPTAVAEQLTLGGVDAISVRNLDHLGDTDLNHLQRATSMGRVLCTHDRDFLRIASEMTDHAGIAFAPQYESTIGGWVRALRDLHGIMSAEQVVGQVVYLSLR